MCSVWWELTGRWMQEEWEMVAVEEDSLETHAALC